MTSKSKANDRVGWYRYYADRFNRLLREDSAQMALFCFLLLVDSGEAPEIAA